MFYRLDSNGIVAEKIGNPYDEKLRPKYHPEIMAQIIEHFGDVEIGDRYDRATGAITKPKIEIDPETARQSRMDEIRAAYLDALLMRNAELARTLETEYLALAGIVPLPSDREISR